eukprot:5203503-Pleurochrysis_carterae.AAC.4
MRRLNDEERKLSAAQSKKESERAVAVSKASQARGARHTRPQRSLPLVETPYEATGSGLG